MQYFLRLFAILCISGVTAAGGLQADVGPPTEGGAMPEIILSVPQSAEHQAYLGVSGKDTFRLPDITAEVVIIEIFSMY